MYTELYQYLIQHKQLPVPGIGTFLLERKPAELDFASKKIYPPSYTLSLVPGSHLPGQPFFRWLASVLGITDREAIFRFNDFAFDLKKQISDGSVVSWNGVGILDKGLDGSVKLLSSITDLAIEEPVSAEKVTRENAEHMIRVGEDQRTSAEMSEMLGEKEEATSSTWWHYALAIALLAIMFIGWYFSEHGVDIAAIANNKKLVPIETGAPYQVIP
ncbi:MAG: hypothetical protein ABI688_02125 [Bacteroidota bacterium]